MDIIGAQKWLNTTIESYKKYGYDFWAAYEKNANTFLGTIGLLNEEIDGKQEPCLAFMIWGGNIGIKDTQQKVL